MHVPSKPASVTGGTFPEEKDVNHPSGEKPIDLVGAYAVLNDGIEEVFPFLILE